MSRKILLIGAGKSTSYLIDYFLDKSEEENLLLTIVDQDISCIPKKILLHPNCEVFSLAISDDVKLSKTIKESDIVVSMLPASLHIKVATKCVEHCKHLVTASYISEEINLLNEQVKEKGLIFMNEIGLDPGIDHMSAMEILNNTRDKGGKILLFESFAGGLVAPDSNTNLWGYKFTWNPRNVVLAGQGGTAKFIQEGIYKYIPYSKLFRRTEFMTIENYGDFEAYANRDSLKYKKAYKLDDAHTLYRGTMRRVGFSKAWDMFIQLGMTDDSYTIENSKGMSYREFVNLFLAYSPTDSVELKLRHYLKIDQDDIRWQKLLELNLFNQDKKISLNNATPAQVLQYILEDNWTLKEDEKDMIVMYHKIGYELHNKKHQIDAHMVVLGENQTHTAMAKTVGLPVAIATLLILNKKITSPGVQIPINKEVYTPILSELKKHGIAFKTKKVPYLGYNPKFTQS